MANTYTKIYLHIVFAVKGREALLPLTEMARMHQYMATMLRNMKQTPVAIGGTEDHVHILIEYRPNVAIPDMVKEIKTAITKLINEHHLIPFKFAWQRGYACFSYSPSQVENVKRYVLNQLSHHKNISLHDEMVAIYQRFGVEFEEQYIFE